MVSLLQSFVCSLSGSQLISDAEGTSPADLARLEYRCPLTLVAPHKIDQRAALISAASFNPSAVGDLVAFLELTTHDRLSVSVRAYIVG